MNNAPLLLFFILTVGVMFLMTRSAKNKQRQAAQMREQIEPGTGVRTIGGMYAVVEEVHDDTVLLEVAPGVHAVYAKNAVGAVLEDDEYHRIVHGGGEDLKVDGPPPQDDAPAVPGDASSPAADDGSEDARVDLGKSEVDEPQDATRPGTGATDAPQDVPEPEGDAKSDDVKSEDAPEKGGSGDAADRK